MNVRPSALIFCIICFGVLISAVLFRWTQESQRQSVSTDNMSANCSDQKSIPSPHRIPQSASQSFVITLPVSPSLWITADRTQSEELRLKPLVDGTVVLIDQPQDILLMRRILLDSEEGDTIRNEAANLLNRSGIAELPNDLQTVLANPAEAARFRSFAMQHLGILWNQVGSPAASPLRAVLLTGLTDRHVAAQREALLALARGKDPAAPVRVEALLADPAASNQHDLCCRIVADLKLMNQLPALRRLLSSGDEVIRIAALDAAARLGDLESLDAVVMAAKDSNPRIASAGKRAQKVLSEVKR